MRAREFIFFTGPRDSGPASTAVWCIRRLHTPTKKRGPVSFVVGCCGELYVAVRKIRASVELGGFVFDLFLCGTYLRGNEILYTRYIGSLCWTRLSGNGIYNFPWRGSGILEIARDAFVRARGIHIYARTFITEPRDHPEPRSKPREKP